jgi:hypothetical protein
MKPKIDKCTICGKEPFDNFTGLCNDHAPHSDRYSSDEECERRWFQQDGDKILQLSGITTSDPNKIDRHNREFEGVFSFSRL